MSGDRALPARGLLANPNWAMLANLSLLWGGQIVTKAITFLAFAILARRLAPAQYGAIEYVFGLATIASLAIEGGLAAVGVRRLNQGEAPAARLAGLIPTGQTLFAAIMGPGLVLFALLFGKDPHATLLAIPIAVSILILPWRQEWLFQAYGRMAPIAIAQLLRTVMFAVGVLLVVSDGSRLVLVGVLEVVSVSVAALYLLVLQNRSIAPIRPILDGRALLDLWREGLSIALSAGFWALMQYAPLMILANMAGMTDGAWFGAAHRLGVSLVSFGAIYHFNFYPILARRILGDRNATDRLMGTSLRCAAWVGIGLALGLALAADVLMPLLFGPSFVAAAPAFKALIWVFPITLLAGHVRWALIAVRRPNGMMWAQAAGFVLAALFAWGLIRPFGLVGAGLSMTLASLCVWVITHFTAVAGGQTPPVKPCLLPAAAAAALFFGVPMLGLNPWVGSIFGGLVFAAVGLIFDRALLRDIASLRPGHGQPEPEIP